MGEAAEYRPLETRSTGNYKEQEVNNIYVNKQSTQNLRMQSTHLHQGIRHLVHNNVHDAFDQKTLH